MSSVITRSSYRKSLIGIGALVLLLGVVLKFAAIKTLYDLPVIMMIIGVWVCLQNVYRFYHPGAHTQDIEINSKTLNNLLTNYAIIIAMIVLVVIICNSTGLSTYVLSLDAIVLASALFILVFASFGFVAGVVVARLLDAPLPDLFSIVFCVGLRNISSGSVIATEFFPGAAIIPVMMGTLFQQILAAVAGNALRRFVGEEQDRQRGRLRAARLLERYRRRSRG